MSFFVYFVVFGALVLFLVRYAVGDADQHSPQLSS